jgi:hypothetical protein
MIQDQTRPEYIPVSPESPLQRQQQALQGLDREDLRRAVQDAQAEVADLRHRFELGELTAEETWECCRRPRLIAIAVGQELERRGEAGR